MTLQHRDAGEGFLRGIRVLEVADELGEYCGKVLAGLGADVIKVEPPGGEKTRRYGPFYHDEPHPERSLYFWHYNFGKRGITLDLDSLQGQEQFRGLARRADVVLDSRPRDYLASRGLAYDNLKQLNPGLVVARISPFGDSGPWADYKGSDLVHLAMGGIMMNCGYDPDPSGFYETSPVAPQMWQAYHIAGELTAVAIMGALYYRGATGTGQSLSTAVHEAVSKQTEGDYPDWVYARMPHYRQTARHSSYRPTAQSIALTKDGRYVMASAGRGGDGGAFDRVVDLLDTNGMADDLKDEKYGDDEYRQRPEVNQHIMDVVHRFVRRSLFEGKWQDAQERGLLWAPVRKPHENLADPHLRTRETFIEVTHPELDQTFTYVGAKWLCPDIPWRRGPRAPLVDEHTTEVLGTVLEEPPRVTPTPLPPVDPRRSPHGKPFSLSGVRMIDLTWWLASGGAGRFLTSQGAELIKVEWKGHWDLRFGNGPPPGGRAERAQLSTPLVQGRSSSPNRSGFFNDINSGKRGISLNMNHPRGQELLGRLLTLANVVAEGFSPGVMERWGFGYDRIKEINPGIIYVQQSGLGARGLYGRFRTTGPIAACFSGITELSGLPEPYPPAGIGYSYLDWFGAYNMATALTAALYRQQHTGKGVYIDSSQVETGTFLNGTAILDYSVNGRKWQRYGNRSPYKLAAPHGAYRCGGQDRWIAIACFTEENWEAFLQVVGNPAWGKDPRFASLQGRLAHQDDLDALINEVTTQGWDARKLMEALQQAGVPAGMCQTAEDRVDHDVQLRHLEWVTEVPHTEMGTWPVKEFPVKFSETPTHMGGIIGRASPCYGEDNEYVYGEILGLSTKEIRELQEQEVI